MELLHNPEAVKFLKDHFGTRSDDDLIKAAYDNWFFCFPRKIVKEDGSIPRTPTIMLSGDPEWLPIAELESHLLPELESKFGN